METTSQVSNNLSLKSTLRSSYSSCSYCYFPHGSEWCDYVGAKLLSLLLHTKLTSVYSRLDF